MVHLREQLQLSLLLNSCAGSGDSPHGGSFQGECGNCKNADPAWSQCEPH